jgi:hypothetical protein
MKAKTSTENFEERIEQLVGEHIAAIRAKAEAAVARGFAKWAGRTSNPAAPQTRMPVPGTSRRRTTKEVEDLAQRLCAAVHASPGETMLVLAPKVGATPGELSVAVTRLRQQGRVRAVGQRQHTRYFPIVPTSAS